ARVFLGPLGAYAFQAGYAFVAISDDAHWQAFPNEDHAVLLGQLIFVVKSGHLLCAAPVDHVHFFRAEAARGRGYVNRRVAGADDRHAPGNGDFVEAHALGVFNEGDGVAAAVQVLAGNAEVVSLAQSHADKDGIVGPFQLGNANVVIHAHSNAAADLDSQAAHHFNFLHDFLGAHLVGGDAVGVKAAGVRVGVKNNCLVSELA